MSTVGGGSGDALVKDQPVVDSGDQSCNPTTHAELGECNPAAATYVLSVSCSEVIAMHDSGSCQHVFKDRSAFSTLESVKEQPGL
ncbi:MAG: hypothetical protein ACKVQA_26185, partial [Burkholderiales bacterium]